MVKTSSTSPRNWGYTVVSLVDVPAVLNQLEAWNKDTAHPFSGRFDIEQSVLEKDDQWQKE